LAARNRAAAHPAAQASKAAHHFSAFWRVNQKMDKSMQVQAVAVAC
jgi:hypothetical protein